MYVRKYAITMDPMKGNESPRHDGVNKSSMPTLSPSIRHFPASVQTASSGNLLTAYDFVVKHGLGTHT